MNNINPFQPFYIHTFKDSFIFPPPQIQVSEHPETSQNPHHSGFFNACNISINPTKYHTSQKATRGITGNNTVEAIGREWFLIWKDDKSKSHQERIIARLENDVFPWIGERPILEIEPPEILMLLRRIESRGAMETAHRVKQLIGQVFRYAVATGRAQRDQSADLKGALKPYRKKHLPAITDPKEVAPLLRAIDDYSGTFIVKCAFRLAPLVMLRPSELSGAEWSEIDFETETWTIPVKRMKARERSQLISYLCYIK